MVPEALLHSGYRRKTDGSRTEFGEAVIQELDLGDDEGLAVDAGRQSGRPRANPAADQEEVEDGCANAAPKSDHVEAEAAEAGAGRWTRRMYPEAMWATAAAAP